MGRVVACVSSVASFQTCCRRPPGRGLRLTCFSLRPPNLPLRRSRGAVRPARSAPTTSAASCDDRGALRTPGPSGAPSRPTALRPRLSLLLLSPVVCLPVSPTLEVMNTKFAASVPCAGAAVLGRLPLCAWRAPQALKQVVQHNALMETLREAALLDRWGVMHVSHHDL